MKYTRHSTGRRKTHFEDAPGRSLKNLDEVFQPFSKSSPKKSPNKSKRVLKKADTFGSLPEVDPVAITDKDTTQEPMHLPTQAVNPRDKRRPSTRNYEPPRGK